MNRDGAKICHQLVVYLLCSLRAPPSLIAPKPHATTFCRDFKSLLKKKKKNCSTFDRNNAAGLEINLNQLREEGLRHKDHH